MENLNKVEYDSRGQADAKRQLINILRRKGTLITNVSSHNELKTYRSKTSFDELVLGGTVSMSIQLAYKKYNQD